MTNLTMFRFWGDKSDSDTTLLAVEDSFLSCEYSLQDTVLKLYAYPGKSIFVLLAELISYQADTTIAHLSLPNYHFPTIIAGHYIADFNMAHKCHSPASVLQQVGRQAPIRIICEVKPESLHDSSWSNFGTATMNPQTMTRKSSDSYHNASEKMTVHTSA